MCSWIPFVRDSPTLPARPVRGRSSARRQRLAMAPYINSYLMVPRAVAYVSLGTFLSSSAGCVAGGSRAAAPPPRRDSTSREEPPTPPSHRDELRPRADSDNKPGSDESVSRQTVDSSRSSPSGRSRSHRAPTGRGQQSDSYYTRTYLSSVTRYLPELASLSSFARILKACHLLWLETYPPM